MTAPATPDLREAVARDLERPLVRGELGFIGPAQVWAVVKHIFRPDGPLACVMRERDEALTDLKSAEEQNEALNLKLHALAPHGSCACSYDRPGDVCSHHSPALRAAEAELATLKAAASRDGEAARQEIARARRDAFEEAAQLVEETAPKYDDIYSAKETADAIRALDTTEMRE